MHTTWITISVTDAVLVLLLVARIHGTDDAVRAAAKRCVKKIPRGRRGLVYDVINSPNPLDLVYFIADHLDD